MLIQDFVWAIAFERIIAGNTVLQGAIGFAFIGLSIAETYNVIAVAAEYRLASVGGYLPIEAAFEDIQQCCCQPTHQFVSRSHRLRCVGPEQLSQLRFPLRS